jgi:hypothetical protein
MPRLQYVGRALPLQLGISVPPSDIAWTDPDTGLSAVFKLRVANSIVNVEIEANRYSKNDITPIFIRAFDLARTSINLVAFATGVGPVLVFNFIIGPNGLPHGLIPMDRNVAKCVTAYDLSRDFDVVFKLVVENVSLFRDINDLIECIWNPHVTPVNCGRVIDSICRMITPSAKGPTKGDWKVMHRALNVSEEYLKHITKSAKGPRHADPAFVPGEITTDVASKAWHVMNRYLEYVKGGKLDLAPPKFELLS